MKKGILILIISVLAFSMMWAKTPVYGVKYTAPPYQPTDTAVLDEGFEGGALPTGWTTEYVNGTVDWAYQAGGQYGNPGGANTGSYNACFYGGSYTPYATYLITPSMDISALSNPTLTFYLANASWAGDQDVLNVYTREAAGAPWDLLATYDTDMPTWEMQTLALPAASSDYYICFEGVSGWGYGVCVDDVVVDEGGATAIPNYLYSTHLDAGNPGGLNTDTDSSTTGCTYITNTAVSANEWSELQTLPTDISFEF